MTAIVPTNEIPPEHTDEFLLSGASLYTGNVLAALLSIPPEYRQPVMDMRYSMTTQVTYLPSGLKVASLRLGGEELADLVAQVHAQTGGPYTPGGAA